MKKTNIQPYQHHHGPCEIEETLYSNGLKRTKDRHDLTLFLQKPQTWTVNNLIRACHHTHRATAFRNIQRFLEKGLIRVIGVFHGETHYEWADREHHDHLSCEVCKSVECVPCPAPTVKNHDLTLHDLCSNCK